MNSSKESGIAIMFTLIMLSIFFLIAFGFISFATSAKSAAKAREPKQSTSLTASESTLNEALFAIEKGLHNGKEVADPSKFDSLEFTNGAKTVTLKTWATSSGDNTSLEDYLLPQFNHATDGEFKAVTASGPWSTKNYGWLTNSGENYAWMVIDSNNLDVNYLGISNKSPGSGFAIPANKLGKYTRELDILELGPDASYRDIYIDWAGATPAVWESKKDLIDLMTNDYETAVEMLEVGTNPVTIMAKDDAFDLELIKDNNMDVSSVLAAIPWLNSSSDAKKTQIAANIKEYVDGNNFVLDSDTDNSTYFGNERVPYINEINFRFLNNTVAPSGTVPTTPTVANLTISTEIINIFNANDWAHHTDDPDGSAAFIEIEGTIIGNRGTHEVINEDFSATATPLSQTVNLIAAGTYTKVDIPISWNGSPSSQTADITLDINITKVTLFGDAGKKWDLTTQFNTSTTILEGDEESYNIEFRDPRVNLTVNADNASFGWRAAPLDGSLNTSNSAQPTGEKDNDSTDMASLSTGFMRPGGGIEFLEELGVISRDIPGQTINLIDYNTQQDFYESAKYRPADSTLDLSDTTTFNAGDRALLDHVRIGTTPLYKQPGIINPNTTNSKIIDILLSNIEIAIPGGTNPSESSLDIIKTRFPSINGSPNVDQMFFVSDFHDSESSYHNRNPKTYGYVFSRSHPENDGSASDDGLNDAQAESVLLRTCKLISPKYSYYTVLTAVQDSGTGTTSSVYSFVRRDNEGGSFKVLKIIEKVFP